ncbi:MAG: aspartate ammonia-lyase [Candidatus Omnitrophica bacterium]|nr:aspartate ammonia-lyase [Candidatus Omnitrophota bacterium]
MQYRLEKDMLGEKRVPLDAYWGIHTARALENFPISGYRTDMGLIRAMAMVKKACALANGELGYIERLKSEAIVSSCEEILAGKLDREFPLEALQGGAGTSTNMNVNEVIANRSSELLGGAKGGRSIVHPLNEVNLHQSTNDVYPTAVKMAAIFGMRELSSAAEKLQQVFQEKEREFAGIVKIGRTEMQSAVPMTLAAEFSAFAEALARDRWRTFKNEERLRAVNLGGTAIGTGLTAPRRYIFLVIEKLREVSGLGLMRGENAVDQTANADVFVEVSGVLKAHAASLVKISNDLRLLNMLGEVRLEAAQAGSSIMPGKVNPVVPEAVIQVGLKVIANDLLVAEAVSRSTLQICEFMPLVSCALLESINILVNADRILAGHLEGLKAQEEVCRRNMDTCDAIVTAFLPVLGYEKAAELLKEYRDGGGRKIREFLSAKLGAEIVNRMLSPAKLIALGYGEDEKNA